MVPKHVLVASDFSASSRRALELVRDLRARLGCAVDVYHLFVDPFAELKQVPEESVWVTADELHAHVEQSRELLRAEVDRVFASEAQSVRTHLERGSQPGAGLLRKAEEVGADLICVGTTGKSGVERMLLGSTSLHVVRHSHIPVLTVH